MRDWPNADRHSTHLVKVLGVRAEVAVSGSRDEKIAAIARLQRGRVGRRQLLAAGLTYKAIRGAVQRGALIPLRGAVFAVGHAGAVELGEETTALLACPDGAALSHHSAARLWEIAYVDDGAVHVVMPEGVKTRADGFRVHRARSLRPQDIRIRRGLPVTSPARTLLDEATELTDRQLELAFDRGLVARVIRTDDVAELLGRTSGRAGAARLAALLERQHGTTMTRSEAEELFLALVRDAQLPPPQVNARVAGYEVDFLWPEQKLIVEIDGYRFHSTYRAFRHDHRKAAALRAAGHTVLQVSFEQLEHAALAVVADVTRALVAARADAPAAQVATISEPSSREMATSTE